MTGGCITKVLIIRFPVSKFEAVEQRTYSKDLWQSSNVGRRVVVMTETVVSKNTSPAFRFMRMMSLL